MTARLVHVGVRATDLADTLRFWRDGRGKPYQPVHPLTKSFKVADLYGIVVDVSADPDQWSGVLLERNAHSSARGQEEVEHCSGRMQEFTCAT